MPHFFFVLGVVLLIPVSIASAAPRYKLTALGQLTAESRGPYDHRSFQLNDIGTVLGQTTVNGKSQATLWKSGVLTPLGLWQANSLFSRGFAINNQGDVAAELDDVFGQTFAAVKINGGNWVSGLYPSGIQFTTPRSINDLRQFVGVASASTFYAFPNKAIYHPGANGNASPVLIPNSSGAIASAAFSIANNGYIAGNVATGVNSEFAAVWVRVSTTQYQYGVLDTVGSTALCVNENQALVGYSSRGATEWDLARSIRLLFNSSGVATGINDAGVVVGNSIKSNLVADPASRAFVYYPSDGLVYDLTARVDNPNGWVLYKASAINNAGQIVGYGNFGGFLLTEIKCPADFNGDFQVDDGDFLVFAQAYNQLTVPPADPRADLNSDGFVDDADFVAFAAAYNNLLCGT